METIEQLLKAVTDINKKYDTIASATGSNFNVFESLDATKEVAVCRILHALLNPQGSHGQGTVFLEAFFDTVLTDIIIDKSELKNALVSREHSIDNQRRIDIYIETANWSIPIEVKIFALDQKSQCVDYQFYAKNRQKKNCKLYYLTPTARELSKESATNGELSLAEEDFSYITFAEDILCWLEYCVSHFALKLAPIREVLLQYTTIIRKFTNKLEDNIMNDIVKIMMSSSENMESAKKIESSLDECRREIMRKLFIEIDRRVPQSKLVNQYDWEYKGKNAKSLLDNYPQRGINLGLNYHLKDFIGAKGKNISVWVRCELDSRPNYLLFVGLCVAIDGKKCDNKTQLFEIEDLIKHGIQNEKECNDENFTAEWTVSKCDWWLYYDAIEAQNGEGIDFGSANDSAYFSLFDPKGFECVVENCVKAIKGYLSRR